MGWLDEPLCVSTEYEVGDANTDCTLSRFCNGSLWEEKHQLGFKIKDYNYKVGLVLAYVPEVYQDVR